MSRSRISHIDEYLLLGNLYLTQSLTLLTGLIVYYLFYYRNGIFLNEFFVTNQMTKDLSTGILLGIIIVLTSVIMEKILPEKYFDDGGINEKLFKNRSVIHILIISFIVAVSEEFLFRILIQSMLGIYWTSLVFALIHVRYLSNWIMPLYVFFVSLGLGWTYEWTGNAWTPISAHFLTDFILGCMILFGRNETKREDFTKD